MQDIFNQIAVVTKPKYSLQKIRINTLQGTLTTAIIQILQDIAVFNARQVGCTLDSHEYYIKRQPKAAGYNTIRYNHNGFDTLEIYSDSELMLSISATII